MTDRYGPHARRAFRSAFLRSGRSYESFSAYLSEHGIDASVSLIGAWATGHTHLPAAVLPYALVFLRDRRGVMGWMHEVEEMLSDVEPETDHAPVSLRVRQLGQEVHGVLGQVLDVLADGDIDPLEARRMLSSLASLTEAIRLVADKLQPIADGERAA